MMPPARNNGGRIKDPYKALGVDHDAPQSEIKKAYHRLALVHHPDRQLRRRRSASSAGRRAGEEGSSDDDASKATRVFAEISAAYALLSDPERKRFYDKLYKFGAFDSDDDDEGGVKNNACGVSSGNVKDPPRRSSWGVPPPPSANLDDDDDLIFGLEKRRQRSVAKSVGFSLGPLGKHLSIHVPSRTDIIGTVARGERLHHYGTRVTFSSSTTSNAFGKFSPAVAPGVDRIETTRTASQTGDAPAGTFVSTTTRIANGQRRVVKRTAHLHRDGRKEVVVEENGRVRGRLVTDWKEELRSQQRRVGAEEKDDAAAGDGSGEYCADADGGGATPLAPPGERGEKRRKWYNNVWNRVEERVLRPCFSPCVQLMVA